MAAYCVVREGALLDMILLLTQQCGLMVESNVLPAACVRDKSELNWLTAVLKPIAHC
jgi:hypothetical protein